MFYYETFTILGSIHLIGLIYKLGDLGLFDYSDKSMEQVVKGKGSRELER